MFSVILNSDKGEVGLRPTCVNLIFGGGGRGEGEKNRVLVENQQCMLKESVNYNTLNIKGYF